MVWPCLPSQPRLEGILSFTHANPSILFSFGSLNAPSNFHSHAALSSSKHHLSRVIINDISSERQSVSTSVPTNIARGCFLWHSHSAPCSYLPHMHALCFSDACKGLLEVSSSLACLVSPRDQQETALTGLLHVSFIMPITSPGILRTICAPENNFTFTGSRALFGFFHQSPLEFGNRDMTKRPMENPTQRSIPSNKANGRFKILVSLLYFLELNEKENFWQNTKMSMLTLIFFSFIK